MKKIKQLVMAAFALVFALPVCAQWADNPKDNLQLLQRNYWNVEIAPTSDGGFYMVGIGPDNNINRVTPVLYLFDKDGNNVWNDSIKFKIDSTMSWTKVMSHLYVDRDDNAIVITQTLCETQRENYTIWKVDKTGKQIWGEDGVDPHNGECPTDQFNAAIRITQMEAGNYIVTWMGDKTYLQNISSDGKLAWGSGKKIDAGAYPHVVDAGDGDCLLVYESSGLNVRRLDFEGNTVWDVKAFSGQLNPQIPSWTYVNVYPVEDPQGRGVLISYYGFVGNDDFYSYISYVKADGTHAFPDADAGLRICYSDNSGMEPALAYDKENHAIYAIFQERAPGTQFTQRFVTQKISEDGELLWGNEGKELIPLKERTTGYQVAAMGPKGNVLFGFMENVGLGISANDPIAVKAAYMNPSGEFIWEDKVKTISSYQSTKNDLVLLPYANDQWIFLWEDCRVYGGVAESNIFAQNLYMDGSMGTEKPNVGIRDMSAYAVSLRVMPNPVREEMRIAYTAFEDMNARIDLIDGNGTLVANVFAGRLQAGDNNIIWQRPASLASGMYILQLKAGKRTSAVKVVLQ